MESHLRSIAKAITWRTGGTFVTFAVAWLVTRRAEIAAQIGLVDTLLKIGAFYLHERAWHHIGFGKIKRPEYEI